MQPFDSIIMIEVPSCEAIAASFADSSIGNLEEAKAFLTGTSGSKSPTDRLLAWLLTLGIVPESRDQWFTSLHQKCTDYCDQTNAAFGDHPDTPLQGLAGNDTRNITNDMRRIVHWLHQISKDAGLTSEIENAQYRLERIYSLISREDNGIQYVQGLDRYGCVCLLVCSMHALAKSLPGDFAESIAFALTRAMLLQIPFLRILKSQPAIIEHFSRVDKVVKDWAPQQYRAMMAGDGGTRFFGCRWEMMLFADEHSGGELLLLWDQVFGRMDVIGRFVSCLTVSHLMQIEIPSVCDSVNDVICHWREWDLDVITADAMRLLSGNDVAKSGCCGGRKCAEIRSDEDIVTRV